MGGCDIVIYTKKYVFGLFPHFWYSTPKTLGISQVVRAIKVSFVTLMSDFGKTPKDGDWLAVEPTCD